MFKQTKFLSPVNFFVLILFAGSASYLIHNEQIIDIPEHSILLIFHLTIVLVYIRHSLDYLIKRNPKEALGSLLIALLWSGIGYLNAKPLIDSYWEFRTTRKIHEVGCAEGNAKECYDIAVSASSAELYLHASKYLSAACMLQNHEACTDLNKLLATRLNFPKKTYIEIAKNLCNAGNLNGCTQEAIAQSAEVTVDKFLPILEKSCSAGVSDACLAIGINYKKSSIIEAEKYLSLACKLDNSSCWELGNACGGLDLKWRKYEDSGQMEEVLIICTKLCEEKNNKQSFYLACGNLDSYKRNAASYNEEKGDLLIKQGKLVEASKYYLRMCSSDNNDILCDKIKNICGRESIGDLLNRASEIPFMLEEKQKAFSLCKDYCSSGIGNACSGVTLFLTHKENTLQKLKFLKEKCQADRKTCEELKSYCDTNARDLLIGGESESSEMKKLCDLNTI